MKSIKSNNTLTMGMVFLVLVCLFTYLYYAKYLTAEKRYWYKDMYKELTNINKL